MVEPLAGAEVVTATVLLWAIGQGSETHFRFQLSAHADFSIRAVDLDDLVTPMVTVALLPNQGQTFYWRVRAGFEEFWGGWSRVGSFVNLADPELWSAPLLLDPLAEQQRASPVEFNWSLHE